MVDKLVTAATPTALDRRPVPRGRRGDRGGSAARAATAPSSGDGRPTLPRATQPQSPASASTSSKRTPATKFVGTPTSKANTRPTTPTLPPIFNNSHHDVDTNANANATSRQAVATPIRGAMVPQSKLFHGPIYNSTFPCKLTALQAAALLKPFWADLLQNQVKRVRRHLADHHFKNIDFNSCLVRYAPIADASPLHLCAQNGLLAMAKMLVGEFGLAPSLQNKVGSTPLHVACKLAQTDFVGWLVDELRVPLDVPDAQHRLAFDVAPFDTVDKCVLSTLRAQLTALTQREKELRQSHDPALDQLAAAQLAFRQKSMALCDAESRLDDERAQIAAVGALERGLRDQLQFRTRDLDELADRYDLQRERLAREQQAAQDLYENEVTAVQAHHARVRQELAELESLVATTQRELDRRNQLLVDQIGLFDASLHEFGGCTQVQEWVLASLLAIASEDAQETSVERVTKEMLLLRAEPVMVVHHVLATFPTSSALQHEAIRLLVVVLRLEKSSSKGNQSERAHLVDAVADSGVVLQLGEGIVRWFRGSTVAALGTIVDAALEALYLCLRLGRNAQRVLALCHQKQLSIVAVQVLENLGGGRCDEHLSSRVCRLGCHTAHLVFTQTQYGLKKVLLKCGVVRTVFQVLDTITSVNIKVEHEPQDQCTLVETAQYLFAALALLTAVPALDGGSLGRPSSKCREPPRLEDLTGDVASIRPLTVIKCLHKCVLRSALVRNATAATYWAFKLLHNLVQHGGSTALSVRQELLENCTKSVDTPDAAETVFDGIHAALTCKTPPPSFQTIQVGLDLIQAVWIERFDLEGHIVSSRLDVLDQLFEITPLHIEQLLAYKHEHIVSKMLELTQAVQALTRATENASNASHLTSRTAMPGSRILKPIIEWILRFVDENRSSYREPNLVQLLTYLLRYFVHVAQAWSTVKTLATSENEKAVPRRSLHNHCRDIGVCAVLKSFSTDFVTFSADPSPIPTYPPEWTALRALSSQIHQLTHCTC